MCVCFIRFYADYTFAFEPIVLLLPGKIQESHEFQWVRERGRGGEREREKEKQREPFITGLPSAHPGTIPCRRWCWFLLRQV